VTNFSGFSKLSKEQKISLLSNHFISAKSNTEMASLLNGFCHADKKIQELFDKFSENTISNYHFPYGVVPDLWMNGKSYCVPMAIEESSVVAAANKSAKFWRARGGFHSEIISTTKIGQVHLLWHGESSRLFSFFERIKSSLIVEVAPLIKNMELRGGGILGMTLVDKTQEEAGYYQIFVTFDTRDAMGANFINSVLENLARNFKAQLEQAEELSEVERDVDIIMSILSNYTPECLVQTYVECKIEELHDNKLEMDALEFAHKFQMACKIAKLDVYRAVTHNKGIFNGIDAVVLATGNDFRAVEAAGHAYAARDGQYRGLTDVIIDNGIFRFTLTIPLSVGTVGGLTSLHPLAALSLEMLGRPSANELMMITSAIGLAQNFGALRSLVTTGIQKGHMKMHLINILNQLQAGRAESEAACSYFADKVISFSDVRNFLKNDMRRETNVN